MTGGIKRRVARRISGIAIVAALATSGIVGMTASVANASPTAWTVQASPNRTAGFNELHDVSCPTTDFCMAVGQITPDAYYLNMGMRWNGHAWRLANPRSRKSSENTLVHVACTSPTFCLAVGYSDLLRGGLPVVVSALVERWDGTRWSIVSNPPGTKKVDLIDVACPGSTTCYIVGTPATAKGGAVFERWDDGVLSDVRGSGLQGWVTGLACPSTTMCVAVGATDSNFDVPRAAQTFDGEHWTDANAAVPSTTAALQNVSCADPTYCMATGFYYDWTLQTWFPLVETFDGTTWTQAPNPPTGYGGNRDVACPATNDCLVAGVENAPGSTKFTASMVLGWDGSQWTHATTPNEGHFSNGLAAVSCVSSTQCVAVGTWRHDHIEQTLALAGS